LCLLSGKMPGMKNNSEFFETGVTPVPFWHNFPDLGIKKWIIISSLLFTLGLVVGVFTPGVDLFSSLENLTEIADDVAVLSPLGLFIFFVVNNIFKVVMSFILSSLLCIFPLVSLILNGWLISGVGHLIVEQYSFGFFMMGIIPHGIFEIPALIIGQAAALSFGCMAIASIFSSEKRAKLLPNFRENVKYLGVAAGLLVIAAVVEAFITPSILNLFI